MSDHNHPQNESKMAWGKVLVAMTLAALGIYYFAAFMLDAIESHRKANMAQVEAQPAEAPAADETAAAEAEAPESDEAAAPVDGKDVYGRICISCHQADGKGNAVFPPLAGSEFATGDAKRAVKIVLHGLSGPITVGGKPFNSSMPAWGAALNDQELAAVLTYVRSSFGNSASAVEASLVADVRKATASQKQPYTADQLK